MNNRRIKKLIKDSLSTGEITGQGSDAEADWNEVLVGHLNNVRLKKIKRKKRTKYALLTAALLVVTFSSLLIITSVDEIKAGNFNLIDAIKNLGSNTEINQIQDKLDYKSEYQKTFNTYTTYKEFFDENQIVDYFKSDFTETGFDIKTIEITKENIGNTLIVYYYRQEPVDMYSIRGYFKNDSVAQNVDYKHPSMEFKAVIIDNIVVDMYISSDLNFAYFEKDSVEFLVEYHDLTDDFIENIVRNIKVYGRK